MPENTAGLEPREINETDAAILAALADDGGHLSPAFLAERMDVSRPYVSQRLARLVEHGHVERPHHGLYKLVDDPRDDS